MILTHIHKRYKKAHSLLPKKAQIEATLFTDSINSYKSLQEIIRQHSIAGIVGRPNYYRHRIGKYRIGFEINHEENSIIFYFIGPRGDFYKNFPPKR